MLLLPYILSALGLIFMVSASLIQGKNAGIILLLVSFAGLMTATSYLITDGINGAVVCYFGSVQSIINYFYGRKNKKIPIVLNIFYAIVIIVLNLIVSAGLSWLGALVIIASLTFILCVGQKNGKKYRFYTIINASLWCVYAILVKSYAQLFQHIILLLFTIIGMIMYDFKQNK